MTKALVCLLGFLTAWGVGNLAVAQQPPHAPVDSHTLPCDSLAGTACDCRTNGDACSGNCFPPNCCCDDYTPRPYPRSCFPAYPSWYKCVPAGDVACCPQACEPEKKRTWWFLPTCHALKEALWLTP
ncbi:hypothetical protein EC9_50580 [Rosistilla ulvae]|uniref:Uncharacterized protein n=1 Tax=Rosistilla ulvae TaxID=1930277 RepID=A0A517M7H9_9BACT|nr:hypothetical protein [Rosistilla ulvae]QDS90840.1 hypothetical protein EC9_50580 [Rosistilla ulvae]